MDGFVAWLQATRLSQAIVFNTWIWPACETLHFIGLALVIGTAGFFDLRLLGLFKRIPVAAARELMTFALAGFLVNLTTGLIFLIGHPEQYAHNVAWWAKVGFLAAAGVNALAFEAMVAGRAMAVADGADTPAAAKAVGLVSLIAWFGVLYWGRMLPFIGGAF
ncbi:MAG TPA: hypothetical protein VH417_02625 [Vicinamibacterales bacterium]|jgi:hypothetical protein